MATMTIKRQSQHSNKKLMTTRKVVSLMSVAIVFLAVFTCCCTQVVDAGYGDEVRVMARGYPYETLTLRDLMPQIYTKRAKGQITFYFKLVFFPNS